MGHSPTVYNPAICLCTPALLLGFKSSPLPYIRSPCFRALPVRGVPKFMVEGVIKSILEAQRNTVATLRGPWEAHNQTNQSYSTPASPANHRLIPWRPRGRTTASPPCRPATTLHRQGSIMATEASRVARSEDIQTRLPTSRQQRTHNGRLQGKHPIRPRQCV